MVAFLLGTLFFQLKDRIPYSKAVFAACCAICLIAALTLPSMPIGQVANRIVLLPVLTYMTVFLGLTPVPLPSLLKSGDYSYGVYLYHDPLLQTIITFLPTIVLLPKIGALALALMGLPAVALLAAFSWHLIEKPILGLRKKFSFVARVRGVDGHSVPVAHERSAKLVARPLVQSQD
ncbi:acyltransferase family protein [Bradyrhizobium sp. RDM4]|uniref:acyltransferase family protein n=1 Tax=Bradyrhizobium sp. RDM4 TaxID=3378765 RepID=UPI0038FC7F1A